MLTIKINYFIRPNNQKEQNQTINFVKVQTPFYHTTNSIRNEHPLFNCRKRNTNMSL